MKKILLSVLLILAMATSFGQMDWNLTFDDTTHLNRVLIDISSNPNNIWQIGGPDKTVFRLAKSSPNVIVTATLKIFFNSGLVQTGKDSCIYIIKQ